MQISNAKNRYEMKEGHGNLKNKYLSDKCTSPFREKKKLCLSSEILF